MLPSLLVGRSYAILPMADRSARAVVDLLLVRAGGYSDDVEDASGLDPLSAALAVDPPFLLWTLWQADLRGRRDLTNVAETAAWLSPRLLELIQFDEEEGTSQQPEPGATEPDSGCQDVWFDHILRSVMTGQLARLAAASRGEVIAAKAHLRGLLAGAGTWPSGAGDLALPRSLRRRPQSAVQASVDLAIGIVQEVCPAVPSDGGQSKQVAKVARDLDLQSLDLDGRIDGEAVDQLVSRALAAATGWVDSADHALAVRLPVIARRLSRLASLSTRFDLALEAEKLESIAEFAAGAGHEINNPLGVIAGRAELLLTGETSADRRGDLAQIVAQSRIAHEMIADMMLFARPPQPVPKSLDADELIARAVEGFRREAAGRRVAGVSVPDSGLDGQFEVVHAPGEQPVTLHADGEQMEMLLRIVLRNAAEAIGRSRRAGRIEVSVEPIEGSFAAIIVADTGPGMTPQERRHALDPYFSGRNAGRGLGLGLSKAWRMLKLHGGRIELESAKDHGTTVRLIVPTVDR